MYQRILDQGLILIYGRFTADPGAVYLLPVYEESFSHLYAIPNNDNNKIQVDVYHDFVEPPTRLSMMQFSYVMVPPSGSGRQASINWKNYAEVKKYMNLTN